MRARVGPKDRLTIDRETFPRPFKAAGILLQIARCRFPDKLLVSRIACKDPVPAVDDRHRPTAGYSFLLSKSLDPLSRSADRKQIRNLIVAHDRRNDGKERLSRHITSEQIRHYRLLELDGDLIVAQGTLWQSCAARHPAVHQLLTVGRAQYDVDAIQQIGFRHLTIEAIEIAALQGLRIHQNAQG